MKELATLLLLFSLSVFSVGCGGSPQAAPETEVPNFGTPETDPVQLEAATDPEPGDGASPSTGGPP